MYRFVYRRKWVIKCKYGAAEVNTIMRALLKVSGVKIYFLGMYAVLSMTGYIALKKNVRMFDFRIRNIAQFYKKKSIRAIMNLGASVEVPKKEWSLFGVCSTTEGTYLQRETIIDTTVTPVVILLFKHNNVLLGIKKPICLIYIYMDIQLYQHNPIELRNPLCHYFNKRWNW